MSRKIDPLEPCLRVATYRGTLVVIRGLAEPMRTRLLDAVGPALTRELDESGVTDWLPVPTTVQLIGSINRVLPRSEQKAFWRKVCLSSVETQPLLRGAITAVLRAVRPSPQSLLKMAISNWGVITKNCGKLEFLQDPTGNSVSTLWHDVPAPLLADGAFFDVHSLGYASILDLIKLNGSATWEREPSGTAVRYHITWK